MSEKDKPWRMKEKCDNCPFHESGPGRHLRDSLNRGRFKEITKCLMRGEHFLCHKTTNGDDWDEETGDYIGGGLVCAGSIEYQEQRGIQSQYMQLRERFEKMLKLEGEES